MSKKRLNLHEQGYKAGDPMWVSWDKRWDGPLRRELMWEGVYQEERLVTTIGFFRYDDREFLALDRTKRPNGCEDIIYIPTPLVKEYGKFHAEQYSTFIRYIFVYNTLVSERLNVRIRRYAEATNYAKVLTGVYNGIPKGENGMIIKYQEPAQPINRSAIRTDEDKNVPKRNRAIYSTFDATWNTPPWYIATAKAARAAYKQVANPDEMDYIVTDSVADAGWRKRLGLSYDSKFLPSNEDGSVRLPSYIEAEIPVDTTLLKDRIARETKIAESKNIMGKDWQLVTGLINLDKQNLDSLRKTYNTGEPTVLNEYSHNSRNLIKNGRLINGAHEYNTPLNILKNYTVQYDSKNRTMNYRDIYDFNGYEWAIPGKKFNIRGSINLDKK